MIHGKPHIKYSALLQRAHDEGLITLEAHFTQVTLDFAVAEAVAVFKDGRRFVESGDATPDNVSASVRPHFRRMALTRAKARALRDALNIETCAAEELE